MIQFDVANVCTLRVFKYRKGDNAGDKFGMKISHAACLQCGMIQTETEIMPPLHCLRHSPCLWAYLSFCAMAAPEPQCGRGRGKFGPPPPPSLLGRSMLPSLRARDELFPCSLFLVAAKCRSPILQLWKTLLRVTNHRRTIPSNENFMPILLSNFLHGCGTTQKIASLFSTRRHRA